MISRGAADHPRCPHPGGPKVPSRNPRVRRGRVRGRESRRDHVSSTSDHHRDEPDAGKDEYKRRNLVERCFNRFNRFKRVRDLATRYAKRAAYYTSELIIVSIILRLK